LPSNSPRTDSKENAPLHSNSQPLPSNTNTYVRTSDTFAFIYIDWVSLIPLLFYFYMISRSPVNNVCSLHENFSF
jgi:hypothetical protein